MTRRRRGTAWLSARSNISGACSGGPRAATASKVAESRLLVLHEERNCSAEFGEDVGLQSTHPVPLLEPRPAHPSGRRSPPSIAVVASASCRRWPVPLSSRAPPGPVRADKTGDDRSMSLEASGDSSRRLVTATCDGEAHRAKPQARGPRPACHGDLSRRSLRRLVTA